MEITKRSDASGTRTFCKLPPSLVELPARGFSDKVLLPKTKRQAWTNGEDGLLHRQNVLLHSLHVELVLTLVSRQEFAARGDVSNFRRALDDDRSEERRVGKE